MQYEIKEQKGHLADNTFIDKIKYLTYYTIKIIFYLYVFNRVCFLKISP